MTSYELWLFLHIAGVIVWLGGTLTGQVFGVLAKRSGDPARTAVYGKDMALVGQRVFLPGAITVFVTGILLTEDGNWSWGEPFVLVGLLGGLAISLTGFGYVARTMGRLGERMASEGPSPEIGRQLSQLVLLARTLIVALFVIVLVMVVKPGT